MDNNKIEKPDQADKKPYKRSTRLTMLCLISFVFFGTLSGLFLAGLLYSEWISQVTTQYIPENQYTTSVIRMLFVAGFIFHACGLIGSVFIWRLKKTGYYLVAISCLTIASFQLLNPNFSATSTIAYILFLIGFGFFYRRMN